MKDINDYVIVNARGEFWNGHGWDQYESAKSYGEVEMMSNRHDLPDGGRWIGVGDVEDPDPNFFRLCLQQLFA